VSLVAHTSQRLRSTRAWSGRSGAIFLLVSGPVLGAMAGAVLRPPPTYPQRAEAFILVPSDASALDGTRVERVLTLAAALTSEPVMSAIKLTAGSPSLNGPVSGTLEVRSNSKRGSLTVVADSETSSAAAALANTAGAYAVTLARRVQAAANTPLTIPVSDFNQGIGSWNGTSQFALRPLRQTIAATGGRFHDGSLVVTCQPVTGCGSGTSVQLAAIPHDTYTGAIWIRALSPNLRATVFIGGAPGDVATAQPVLLTPTWHRLAVSWTASRQHPAIEVGVLSAAPRAGRFVIDAASVTTGPAPPSGVQERVLASDAAAATALPAQAAGPVPVGTLGSAALGALAGLLAALAGCAAGVAARRRQHGSQQ
jgi:hypothetical protein